MSFLLIDEDVLKKVIVRVVALLSYQPDVNIYAGLINKYIFCIVVFLIEVRYIVMIYLGYWCSYIQYISLWVYLIIVHLLFCAFTIESRNGWNNGQLKVYL